VLALIAVFALPAAASAATFRPLNEERALPIATKLARQVAVKRKVRSWNLSPAVKVRPNRVVFIYSDRSRAEVFCTAKLVVEQSSRLRHAFLAARTCNGIPSEALEMERATSALIRAVEGQRADVRRSVRAYEADLAKCEGLVVPRSRHEEVELLYEAGELHAAFDPLLVHLDGFVTRLQQIQPEDPALASGVVWWRRLVTSLDALPDVTARPCSAVLTWADSNYSDDTAPVDFAQLSQAIAAMRAQERGIIRAAAYLEGIGISPRIVPGFVPEGLLVVALGEEGR
jgi:hypothetical protein